MKHAMKLFGFVMGLVMVASPASAEYCREYTQDIVIGNELVQGFGQTCRQPDGSWQIKSQPQVPPEYQQQQPQQVVMVPATGPREVVTRTYREPRFSLVIGNSRPHYYYHGRSKRWAHGQHYNPYTWHHHWKHHKKHHKKRGGHHRGNRKHHKNNQASVHFRF